MNRFTRKLKEGNTVILDGGLATELEAQGCNLNSRLWSAALLADVPCEIKKAHNAYLTAGAEILITASYQASRSGFASLGLSAARSDELLRLSVSLAQQATRESGRPDALVAASIGPFGAAQHDGSEYTGQYSVHSDDLIDFHRQRLSVLDQTGADVLACETIPNIGEARVLAELLAGTSTPAWISFCCRNEHQLSDGTEVRKAAALFAGHPTVRAIGVNCTPPQHISSLIAELRAGAPDLPIAVYPNSGEQYDAKTGQWSGLSTPLELAKAARTWRTGGAQLIGGCCRMGPAHIQAIAHALKST